LIRAAVNDAGEACWLGTGTFCNLGRIRNGAKQGVDVSANPSELMVPARGLLAALRRSISRDEFFACLYILGCANGLLGRIIYALHLQGWTGAVLGVDINVIVLLSCFAGISVFLFDNADEIRFTDLGIAVPFLILVILPVFSLSWVAVTGLSLYLLLFANSCSAQRRGAFIFLALTVPMLWSRLFFQFFTNILLEIDAALAASLLGTDRIGNIVRFADDSGYMMVTPACASFANLSFVFLCWVSISQWANHRWSSIDLVWSSLAGASVVAVNVLRIAVTGLSHENYDAIHNQWGEMILGLVILCLTVGFSVLGARRELFSRL
jgi:hypothetical protein